MKVLFMSQDCPFCPTIIKAVNEYNDRHPFREIRIVDVDSYTFPMYEPILFEIQEETGEQFGTPAMIFDNIYITGVFAWRGVLKFLETLN